MLPGGQVHSPGTLIYRGSPVGRNGLPLQVLPGGQVHSPRTSILLKGSPVGRTGPYAIVDYIPQSGTMNWLQVLPGGKVHSPETSHLFKKT